jgi:predicted MFS family arabinose efflux permease
MAVAAWGWRWTMGGIAIAGAALAIVIWAAVRDRPHETARRTPLLSGLYSVMRRRETWLASAYGLAMTAPMLSFAGLWAVPYLTTIYGMSRPAAAGMSSLMFLGWAIGAPAIGWLSDHVQRRRLLMVGFGTLSAASLTALVLVPDHSLPALAGLFFVNGVGSCSMILAFAHAREHNTRETGGAALGFVNTAVVGSGALFQPLLGALLDLRWDGTMESGVRLYALDAYQLALAALPLTAAAGVAAAIAMRETYARPQA